MQLHVKHCKYSGVGDSLHAKMEHIQIVKLIALHLSFFAVLKTLQNAFVLYPFSTLFCLYFYIVTQPYLPWHTDCLYQVWNWWGMSLPKKEQKKVTVYTFYGPATLQSLSQYIKLNAKEVIGQ